MRRPFLAWLHSLRKGHEVKRFFAPGYPWGPQLYCSCGKGFHDRRMFRWRA